MEIPTSSSIREVDDFDVHLLDRLLLGSREVATKEDTGIATTTVRTLETNYADQLQLTTIPESVVVTSFPREKRSRWKKYEEIILQGTIVDCTLVLGRKATWNDFVVAITLL